MTPVAREYYEFVRKDLERLLTIPDRGVQRIKIYWNDGLVEYVSPEAALEDLQRRWDAECPPVEVAS